MQPEIIALLYPEPAQASEESAAQVTAVLRDADGAMEVRRLKPDRSLLNRALLTGRFNSGKPIVDPMTREIIGYEIEPLVSSC
jgi:hypothetical protein